MSAPALRNLRAVARHIRQLESQLSRTRTELDGERSSSFQAEADRDEYYRRWTEVEEERDHLKATVEELKDLLHAMSERELCRDCFGQKFGHE